MSNACPMIARCAERQDPNDALDSVEPFPVILWDAYVLRAPDGVGGVVLRTWAMVLK